MKIKVTAEHIYEGLKPGINPLGGCIVALAIKDALKLYTAFAASQDCVAVAMSHAYVYNHLIRLPEEVAWIIRNAYPANLMNRVIPLPFEFELDYTP